MVCGMFMRKFINFFVYYNVCFFFINGTISAIVINYVICLIKNMYSGGVNIVKYFIQKLLLVEVCNLEN